MKCGLDGANRQELVRFGAAEAFTCLPAADEKNLYAVVADYGAGSEAVKQIVTVDLATGGVSVVSRCSARNCASRGPGDGS